MNVSELRNKPTEELENELKEKKESLFNIRFRNILGQLEDASQLKQARKDIAQMKTILRARELGIEDLSS
ncbi:50S ribosomal protein L29 [Candidatus Poribacteria bacterium]|nr:50S ribosomal protein L29 [Candidatus Poribacteria bacterium]